MQALVIFDIIFVLGRVILGGFFLYMAFNHFTQLDGMAQYAKMKNIPNPKLGVFISGILLGIGGISILTGFLPEVGIISLSVFLISTAFLIHNFWTIEEGQMRMGEKTNFLKNMGLLGGVLMLAGISTPWVLSLTL